MSRSSRSLRLSSSARERERLDVRARPAAVLPQAEQLPDLLDRKAEVARAPDELQSPDLALVVIAITRIAPGGGRDDADLLIMADHAFADAARRRDVADLHSRTPRRRSELPITVTELSDIAAPAMIGDSRIWNQG